VGHLRTRELLKSLWQNLGIRSTRTPLGLRHKSPTAPIPGDLELKSAFINAQKKKCSSVVWNSQGAVFYSHKEVQEEVQVTSLTNSNVMKRMNRPKSVVGSSGE